MPVELRPGGVGGNLDAHQAAKESTPGGVAFSQS